MLRARAGSIPLSLPNGDTLAACSRLTANEHGLAACSRRLHPPCFTTTPAHSLASQPRRLHFPFFTTAAAPTPTTCSTDRSFGRDRNAHWSLWPWSSCRRSHLYEETLDATTAANDAAVCAAGSLLASESVCRHRAHTERCCSKIAPCSRLPWPSTSLIHSSKIAPCSRLPLHP